MNASFDPGVYKEALLFLATAGVVAPLFVRLRLSPVLGFLLAGVALGPFGLGKLAERTPWLDALALTNVDAIARLAAFGVVVLLFTIGLELSFERLKRMRRLVFEFGLAQLVLCSWALGLAAYALGQSGAAAATIGAALSLSSTAIVMPVLAERKRLGAPVGRMSFAVLLLQDLAVAPLLVLVTMLSSGRVGNLAEILAFTLAPAALGLVAVFVVGRLVLRPLFRSVALTRSPEFFMAACMLVVLGAALTAAASGLSMALGAFVAGLLLAEHRVPARDPGDHRAVQGPAARPVFRFGRRRSSICRSWRARPGLMLGARRGLTVVKAADRIRAGAAVRRGEPRRRRDGAAARAGRRIRLRHDRPPPSPAGWSAPTTRRTLLVAVALSMMAIPTLGRLGAALAMRRRARDLDARGDGGPARRRQPPRHHRRLRPRRHADRRDARRPPHSVHRRRRRSQSDCARAARRQAGLLRRRLTRGFPAPLRPRDGARAGRHPQCAQRQRGRGRRRAPAAARHHADRPRPRRGAARASSTSSGSPTPCRRRSRRACNSPRRRWSTSACRWGW